MSEGNGKPVKFKPVKLAVAFKGVSLGDCVAGIGVSISLEDVKEDSQQAVTDLFRWLCTRHIKAQLILGRRNDGETQGKLIATDVESHAEFDTGRLSVSTKNASVKLTAPIDQIDIKDFASFGMRAGWLKILSVMEEIDTGDEEADPDAKDAERPMLAKK